MKYICSLTLIDIKKSFLLEHFIYFVILDDPTKQTLASTSPISSSSSRSRSPSPSPNPSSKRIRLEPELEMNGIQKENTNGEVNQKLAFSDFDKEEVIRLMIQSLNNLGLRFDF